MLNSPGCLKECPGPMRVLVDIVHPADVLFFRHPLRRMMDEGAQVLIASREKDVACDLLDEFGLPHRVASRAGKGTLGLARELVVRDAAVWRMARRFRPDVMVGFGGVAIAHVGKLTGIPSLSFYAADTASLQTRLTWPFISRLYVPEPYAGPVPDGRTTRFPGVKELSYFHPENFVADAGLARRNGWGEARDNFFVRTVGWNANHDLGKSGWSDEDLLALVDRLSARGKVHISSERVLPAQLQPHLYRGDRSALHHVMAQCRLYVGESATMAHEAAFLGVPSIYDGADHPGTTRELASHGMLVALRQPGLEQLLAAVDGMLAEQRRQEVRAARDLYIADRPNLAGYIADAVRAAAR